jgi:hypothetical protein
MSWKESNGATFVPPLLVGVMGPPGGGKTYSALRVATGMQRARGGDIIVGDTERGRALKYHVGPRNPDGFTFRHFQLEPPFKPEMFVKFIREMAESNPAAILIDSLSDEHEGEGGYLDWHDEEVPRSGGNEWAAWKKPSNSRRKLVAGIQQIAVPLVFTFRAREKTKQVGKKVEKIGYVPIAPSEIVGTLDLACLLQPRSNGVAQWYSDKPGEDYVLKVADFLQPYIRRGMVLDEDFGEGLANWQLGKVGENAPPKADGKRTPQQMVDAYVGKLADIGKLSGGADDMEKGLDTLRAFQADPATVKFVDSIRDKHPALYDRIVTANSRRARELMGEPADEDTDDDRQEERNDVDA